MAPPHERLPRWITGAALGAQGGAVLRLAVATAGATPSALLGAAAAVALGLGLGLLLYPARRDARGLAPLLILPGLAAVAAPLTRALGAVVEGLALDAAAVSWALLAIVALAVVPGARRIARPHTIGAALGLAVGFALPPVAGAALGAVGLVFAASPEGQPARAPAGELGLRALGAGAATLGGAWLYLSTRATLDPSALGFTASAFGFVAASAAGARVLRARAGGAALLGVAWMIGLWAVAGPAVPRLDDLSAALFDGARALGAAGPLLLAVPALGIGAAAGLGAGAVASGPALGLGAALGLLGALASIDRGGWTPLVIAAALAASAVLWGARRDQLLGVGLAAIAGALAFVLTPPEAHDLVVGRYANQREPGARDRDARLRADQETAWAGFSGGVAGAVSAASPTWKKKKAREDGAARPDIGEELPAEPLRIEIDGLMSEARSRAAATEALAGQLAWLLAASPGRALVLGDDTGRALRGGSAFERVTVATPVVPALRAAATLDPGAALRWLSGGVRLVPAHPELVLHSSGAQDAILEVSRAPWGDGARSALSAGHFAAVAKHLNPGGVYVLVLHLGWWAPETPAAALGELARSFDAVQLWLPPSGADSAIVVAAQAPLPLDRLIARLGGDASAPAPEPLRELGLDSAADLASLAVLGDAAVRAYAETSSAADPLGLRGLALSPAVLARPVLHLAGLGDRVASPDEIWASPLPDGLDAPLRARLSARAAFLAVVGDAARGDMEAVFTAARSLRDIEGEIGRSALDPLLEPHLDRGRNALNRARTDGVASPRWDEAKSAAVTAQMLNPDSPAPLVLLGDIALAQGNTNQAETQYQAAIERDKDDAAALTGLARVYRLRKDATRAEQALREAARAAPRQWAAWQNLGVFLLEQRRYADAEDALRRSAALAAGLPASSDPNQPSPAQSAPHMALAELYLATEVPTRALIEIERAVREGGGAYAWYLRGRAHFDLAQYDLAEDDFRQAVLADPDLIEARGAIGHLRAMQRDWRAAADSFRAVLARDPNNAPARENLKMVLEEIAKEEAN